MRFAIGDEVRDALGREGRVTTPGVSIPAHEVVVKLVSAGTILYYRESQLAPVEPHPAVYQ